MTRAWFIRHGQSESNAGLRSAWPDMVHLTAVGRLQSDHLASVIPGPPDRFVTSAYVRTKETAAPALAQFPDVPQAEWPVHEFTYLTPARYRDTTMAERWPSALAYWETADPAYVDGPGAESFIAFIERLQTALARLRADALPWTVVFSHGMVIRALLWLQLTQPVTIGKEQMVSYRQFLRSVKMPNATIWPVGWRADGAFQMEPFVSDHLPPDLLTG